MPLQIAETLNQIIPQLIPLTLPLIGLAVTVLAPVAVILKGTKAYGPLTILLGLTLTAYVYTMLQGGSITITTPTLPPLHLQAAVGITMHTLMYLFLLPPILTVIKGVLITVQSVRKTE